MMKRMRSVKGRWWQDVFNRIAMSLFFVGNIADLSASSHHPEAFLHSIQGQKDEARQIVEHFCSHCHALKPMIPLGAPKIGKVEDWQVRQQQGMQTLFQHTEQGIGLMPARGGCFECSDHQLKMAIEYLIKGK